ncbi:MAG TPA: hypothetical protein VFM09_04615 [Marmoricola sp.]|nr:hypothetical protein [Marmoricola sp.]
MKKLLPALAAVLAVATTAAGCGSGNGAGGHDLSASEQKVADTMSHYLAKNGNGSVSKHDAQCISEHWVQSSGVAKLKKSKVLTANGQVNTGSDTKITPSLANDYADALLGCINYPKMQAQAVAKVNPKIDASKMAACFAKAMPKAQEKKLLVSTMTGNPDQQLTQQNAQAIQTCQAKAQK